MGNRVLNAYAFDLSTIYEMRVVLIVATDKEAAQEQCQSLYSKWIPGYAWNEVTLEPICEAPCVEGAYSMCREER